MVYRRRELWLLLLLAVSLGAGLAVREFRAGFPDFSDRLENLDREEPVHPGNPAGAVPPPSTTPAKIRAAQQSRVDLNQATAEDLQRLPGIGPTLAGQIVRARERRGRFASPEDLRAVPGIGPKKFEGIRDLVTVGEGRGAEGGAGDGTRGAGGGVGDGTREAEGRVGDHTREAEGRVGDGTQEKVDKMDDGAE